MWRRNQYENEFDLKQFSENQIPTDETPPVKIGMIPESHENQVEPIAEIEKIVKADPPEMKTLHSSPNSFTLTNEEKLTLQEILEQIRIETTSNIGKNIYYWKQLMP